MKRNCLSDFLNLSTKKSNLTDNQQRIVNNDTRQTWLGQNNSFSSFSFFFRTNTPLFNACSALSEIVIVNHSHPSNRFTMTSIELSAGQEVRHITKNKISVSPVSSGRFKYTFSAKTNISSRRFTDDQWFFYHSLFELSKKGG